MESLAVRLGPNSSDFYDVRIAVVGNVDSGKSTLIGVLTGGQLDNGRGLARSRVFVHNHEQENGRTSCISQHIMGISKDDQPIHQPVAASASAAQKNKSWKDVVAVSRSVITFIDLAGHEKYLKTTIAGLTGCYPDYAFVIINSLAGITKMTKEHLGVVIALDIPLICIVTKVDMVPENVLERSKKQMDKILKSPGAKKLPIHVRNEADIDTVIQNPSSRMCPILYLSSVTGVGLPLLHRLLARLRPRRDWLTAVKMKPEFSIDDTFAVTGVGVVVSGTVRQGTITPNTSMLIGPIQEGDHSTWKEVLVRSIHCKRCPVESVQAGNSCALSLRAVKRKDGDFLKRQHIRRGMVLVDPELNPKATRLFDAEVLVLHHPTTIKLGYQAVIHAGIIRQTASIVNINRDCLRTGDRATVRFRFLLKEEYIHEGTTFVFREGSTKGIGRIVQINFTDTELQEAAAAMEDRKSKWHSKNNAHSKFEQSDAQAQEDSAASSSAATTTTTSNGAESNGGHGGKNSPNASHAGASSSPPKVSNLALSLHDKPKDHDPHTKLKGPATSSLNPASSSSAHGSGKDKEKAATIKANDKSKEDTVKGKKK